MNSSYSTLTERQHNFNNKIIELFGSSSPSQTVVLQRHQQAPTIFLRSGNNTPQHSSQSTMGPPRTQRAIPEGAVGGSNGGGQAQAASWPSPRFNIASQTPVHQYSTLGPSHGALSNWDDQSSPGSIQPLSSNIFFFLIKQKLHLRV